MDASGFLLTTRIAVIGMGLMGGSLAMALNGRCREIVGVDVDGRVLQQAVGRGIIDLACLASDPLPQVELIVLAAPVRAILAELDRLALGYPWATVVMDLGSTKRAVVEAMAALPEHFDPVGGHPMCGKETSGLENADAALFKGASFALVRLERTRKAGYALAQAVVQAVGARLVEIDADRHDRWTAATSHAPYLLANALAAATPSEARPLIGGGLRSTTRLAPSSLDMMIDILETNRDYVLAALSRVRLQLDQLETALAAGDEAGLKSLLAEGADHYNHLMQG